MADPGMKPIPPAQTTAGCGSMEQQEIQLGLVTYEIQRAYQGDQPIQELVMAHMEREYLAYPAHQGPQPPGPRYAGGEPHTMGWAKFV